MHTGQPLVGAGWRWVNAATFGSVYCVIPFTPHRLNTQPAPATYRFRSNFNQTVPQWTMGSSGDNLAATRQQDRIHCMFVSVTFRGASPTAWVGSSNHSHGLYFYIDRTAHTLFLLSREEAATYFTGSADRLAKPTAMRTKTAVFCGGVIHYAIASPVL